MENTGQEVRSIGDYVRVVRRRKWLILSIALLFPLAALLYSLERDPLYRASAEVLLNRTTFVTDVTGGAEPAFNQQPDRVAATEASVASVPEVAKRVLATAHISDMTVDQFLAQSSATARPDADLLVLSVQDGDRDRAALLASVYAREFTAYRKELDTAAIEQARRGIVERIDELRKGREHDRALLSDLQAKAQQLQTAEALATGNTSVIRAPTAAEATKVQPRPLRDALLAAGAGLLLGVVLAFFRDAVDTRIRSSDEIAEHLGVPLLARIPAPPRAFHMHDSLVMLADPDGVQAEAFRMLRTNLDFVNLERRAQTIMVTSASEREGKSTTVANLALALARGGKDVVLVDLDLRRPFLHRFFNLDDQPGVTHVVVNDAPFEEALAKVWVAETRTPDEAPASAPKSKRSSRQREAQRRGGEVDAVDRRGSNGRAPLGGLLEVMPAGTRPPNPGEFVATRALENLLKRLRERADVVLIDAPPLIGVGDAMTISAKVDGVVVVARMNLLTRPQVGEVHRLLSTSPAETLGFVVSGAEAEEDRYGYGVDGYHSMPAERDRRQRAAGGGARKSRSRRRTTAR
jgi:Mrp family chromosome partitioning ATPase/capsular polysaccharide biosynthesis protein